jgi:PqqD family protein of HPr-rel-A system
MDSPTLALSDKELLWQDWGDCYISFQPSSGETHLFNETTASALRCLGNSPATLAGLLKRTEALVGAEPGEISPDDFAFIVARLDELGLVEYI